MRRIGFTTRASCLLAAGLTAVLCGIVLGEIDLVRAGVLSAAVPVVAAVIVHRSRVRVANRRSLDPPQATAGQSVTVHLTITNRSRLPTGALMLEDQLPERFAGGARFVLESLGNRQARTVSYRMPNLRRGRYCAGPLRIRLSDPFHMVDLTRSFTQTSEFVVLPVVDSLPPIEPPRSDELGDSVGSHSVGAHGADDASTREYRTGDDLRKIHWKSSARRGSLMVRQEERPWRGQTTLLLDLREGAHGLAPDAATAPDPRTVSSLEWAISSIASIGTQAIHAGRDVALITDGSGEVREHFGDADRLSAHLALVRSSTRHDLQRIAGSVRLAARDSALVAVLGRLDPDALRLLAGAHPRGRSSPALALLLDVDSWARPNREPDVPEAHEVAATAAVLRSAGWRTAVITADMPIALAWQLLLAGNAATLRVPAVRR